MNTRNILISIALVLVIFGVAGFYFYKAPKGTVSPIGEFPGESSTSTKAQTGGTGGQEQGESGAFIPGPNAVPPRLYELHKLPVAGVGFFESRKGSGRVISARYIERGLGHIFETPLTTYKESRVVNETRPRISEALWGNAGKSVVIRTIDDKEGGIIKTNIINIGAGSVSFARGTTTDSFADTFLKTEAVTLPDNIPFMATAGDSADKLFYLEDGVGSTATFKDTGISKIFNSSFTEWLPQFPNQNLTTLTTRPSATVAGHMFFLNPSTKSVTKILGGINGLTTLTNPTGKFVLYSETKGGVPEVSLYDTTKKEVHPLYIQTLPEKCVWSVKKPTLAYCAVPQNLPNASYPDQWYQGLVSFSDALWEIDATTFIARRVMETKPLGAPAIDMTTLALSSDDSYLLFMNKITGTPWVYSIVAPTIQRVSTVSTTSLPTKTKGTASVVPDGMQRIK